MARPNHRLNPRKNAPSGPRIGFRGRSSIAASAGLSVSALNAEITTDTAIVTANCWYIRPVIPGTNAVGTNTATRISAIAMTGPDTSSIALSVASRGASPCSMWCSTASTTTIASSTTSPIASTSPNSDSVLIENPSSGNTANVPTSDTGTASSGISVARNPCRNTNTTRITSPSASNSVLTISSIPAVTASVVSSDTTYSRSSGKRAFISSISALARFTVARAFEPGSWYTAMTVAGLAVQPPLDVVALGAELDAGHVLHPHHRPVGRAPGSRCRRTPPASGSRPWRAHRVGELLARRHGVRSDLPAGVGGALRLDGVDHVVDGDLELGEQRPGRTQKRIAYWPAPKTCTWPMPGTRVIGSLMLM